MKKGFQRFHAVEDVRPVTSCKFLLRPTVDRLSTTISTALSTNRAVETTYSKQDPQLLYRGLYHCTTVTRTPVEKLILSFQNSFLCHRRYLKLYLSWIQIYIWWKLARISMLFRIISGSTGRLDVNNRSNKLYWIWWRIRRSTEVRTRKDWHEVRPG